MHQSKITSAIAPRLSAFGQERGAAKDTSRICKAEAACQLLTSRGLADDDIVETAVTLIEGEARTYRSQLGRLVAKSKPSFLHVEEPTTTASTHLQVRLENIDAANTFIGLGSPQGFAARLLSPSRNEQVIDRLQSILHLDHEEHGEALIALRSSEPASYDALVRRGDAGATLRLAIAGDPRCLSRIEAIVTDHLLFLSIGSVHKRMKLVKHLCQSPLGTGFNGHKRWLFIGSICKDVLVDPARLLSKFIKTPFTTQMTDSDAIDALANRGLLPRSQNGDKVAALATQVRARLTDQRHVQSTNQFIASVIAPLAAISTRDLSSAGWAYRDFCEEYLGFSATEVAVIMALELLACRSRIRSCIDAIKNDAAPDEGPLQDATLQAISNNKAAQLTEALRVESQSDRRAPRQVAPLENRNSKQLILQTRARLAERSPGDAISRGLAILRLDPRVWFDP